MHSRDGRHVYPDPSIPRTTTHDVLTEGVLLKTIDSDLLSFLEIFSDELAPSADSLDTQIKTHKTLVVLTFLTFLQEWFFLNRYHVTKYSFVSTLPH